MGLPLADILEVSFTFIESLFLDPIPSFWFLPSYWFPLLLLWKSEWEFFLDFIFTPLLDWLLRDFYLGNHFPSNVWRCSVIAWLPILRLQNLISRKLSFVLSGRFEPFRWILKFQVSFKKNVLWALVHCSCVIYSILFRFSWVQHLLLSHLWHVLLFLALVLVPITFFSVCFGFFLLEAFFRSVWSLAGPSYSRESSKRGRRLTGHAWAWLSD